MNRKKIIITGATSGIGLEIYNQLKNNNNVMNISRKMGINLTKKNGSKDALAIIKNEKPDFIFLNSGVGSFTNFNEVDYETINELISINLINNIYLISNLKNEIKKGLKLVVTLSTASYINGAYEALYNASKKALKEYIVSVNTELKEEKINNMIFSFVPHKIDGTMMTSHLNKPSEELSKMISNLILAIDANKNKFIPKYKEIYKKVFQKYKENPYEQGKDSIEYKRIKNEK